MGGQLCACVCVCVLIAHPNKYRPLWRAAQVIMYIMLVGYPPFWGDDDDEVRVLCVCACVLCVQFYLCCLLLMGYLRYFQMCVYTPPRSLLRRFAPQVFDKTRRGDYNFYKAVCTHTASEFCHRLTHSLTH